LPGLLAIGDDGVTVTASYEGKLRTVNVKTNVANEFAVEIESDQRTALSFDGQVAAVGSKEQYNESDKGITLFSMPSGKFLRRIS
jgi:hypothetical protein